MIRFHTVGVAVLTLALLTNNAAAQMAADGVPASSTMRGDSLWKGTFISRERQGIRASLILPDARSLPALATVRQNEPKGRRDSVWNGALIGGGIGAGGGYIWARNICGSNDSECFAIAGPVGILGGIGIGAAVGAVADALHK